MSGDEADLEVDAWPVVQRHMPVGEWSASLAGAQRANPFTGLGARR